MSDSVWPHRRQPTRLPHPWDSPGKNTGVGCSFFVQGIFLTQESNPGFLHCRQILYQLSYRYESWTIKKAERWRIDAFEVWCWRTLESPLASKEIKPVNPRGHRSWIFNGRADVEAEAQLLWPPDVKSQLIGKDSDAGKDWGQEEKGATEDEMVGWHHRLNGHEFEQTPGDSEGQGSLGCCSPWGCKELDMTERLNKNIQVHHCNNW